jgi:AraC-like DNA-binding protein
MVTGAFVMMLRRQVFADPDDLRAAIRGADVEYTVIERGDFRARLVTIESSSVLLQHGLISTGRIVRATVQPDRIALTGWLGTGPLPTIQGRQLLPGELVLHAPGTETLIRSTSGSLILSIVMAPAHLSAAAVALTGHPVAITSDQIIRPPAAATERFLSLAQRASQMVQTAARAPLGAEITRAFNDTVTRALLGCLVGQRSQSQPMPTGPRGKIMAEFMNAAEADSNQPRYMTDLCQTIGVSGRILRQYCHDSLGMSPHRFLTLRRLHLARLALLHGDPAVTNVTAIATRFGFWELGRFAVTYRSAFGESPSVTLRRFGAALGAAEEGPISPQKVNVMAEP